jgi:hypothetical protein
MYISAWTELAAREKKAKAKTTIETLPLFMLITHPLPVY